jgi:uncharacterized membrane protein YdbT with pleckstrin-like domain
MEYKQSFPLKMAVISILFLLLALPTLGLSLVALAVRYYQWKKYRVLFNGDKVILECGVFAKKREQVLLEKVQKIRIIKRWYQLPFKNVGTIALETGNDFAVLLEDIDNGDQLYKDLEAKISEKK